MIIRIKNNTLNPKTYNSQEIQPGEYYTIEEHRLILWQSNDDLDADILAGDAVVNNGVIDITDPETGRLYLNQNVGWELLAHAESQANGQLLESPVFLAKRLLKIIVLVKSYGPPGDIVAFRFNNDAGNNYRYRWISATITGPNVSWKTEANASGTDRIKLAGKNSQLSRTIETTIFNLPEKQEKVVNMTNATGTNSANSHSDSELGTGAWISPVDTQITKVSLITSVANFGSKTGFVVFGRDF